jgi:glycosyltransferase involved in cell wall biosynthesis
MTELANRRSLVSIVVPVYNEELTLPALYSAVTKVAAQLEEAYEFEFVFTDNHSTDRTFQLLHQLALSDPRVRVFRFSRNFGFQRSILSGYVRARGDVAVQLDCDLQDPPELIPVFLEHWRNGAEIVYGIRTARKEGWLLNAGRSLFYRLIDRLSEHSIPVDAGDFRLISRRIIDLVAALDDAKPYLRGTIASLGFKQVGVEYERNARVSGESKFPFSKLVSLAVDGILNHSTVPLRLSTYFGFFVSMITFLGVILYLMIKLMIHTAWPAGFATLAVLILGSISINAMLLGIIGEYLGRMYMQMKKGPLTIVESSIDAYANSDAPHVVTEKVH